MCSGSMGMGVVNFDECRCFYAVSLNGHDPLGTVGEALRLGNTHLGKARRPIP